MTKIQEFSFEFINSTQRSQDPASVSTCLYGCPHTPNILLFVLDKIHVLVASRSDLHLVNIFDELVARVTSLKTRLLSLEVGLRARIAEGMAEAWEKEGCAFARTRCLCAREIIGTMKTA
jgi:hypothetical protein